ncbi:MAG: carbon storage regulator CsrA [Verrucomicrobiae bacterium]|nr:carbon storage regulator CsrA [Verrucomicrobiae bacterium]
MLVLSRQSGQSIVIDGRIIVRVLRIESDTVKLGIEAPPDVAVHREEVYHEIQQANRAAQTSPTRPLPKWKRPS